jgi:hypothetical protein
MLAQRVLSSAPYITMLGGLVRDHITNDGGKVKTIPVCVPLACVDCGGVDDGKEIPFMPDAKQAAVAYFETIGSPSIVQNRRQWTMYQASFRFVAWVNTERLTNHRYLENSLSSAFRGAKYGSVGGGVSSLRVISVQPDFSSPFDRFTYNEKESQFLAPPYSWLSLTISVQFIASSADACISAPGIKDTVC